MDDPVPIRAHARETAIAFIVPGEPIGFARTSVSAAGRFFTPDKQRAYMAEISILASLAIGGMPPIDGPVELAIRATYPVPASWSIKRKDAARWKTSKVDLSNIVKLVEDALNNIVWKDDQQVASIVAQKVYGEIVGLTVSVVELEPD